MGGGSNSETQNNGLSTVWYKKTTTDNPFVRSVTNNSGTTTSLKDGTALKSVYDYTNANIDDLLNQYLIQLLMMQQVRLN